MLTELREYVDACFTGLWVQTHEPEEALAEVKAAMEKEMTVAPRRRITRRPATPK